MTKRQRIERGRGRQFSVMERSRRLVSTLRTHWKKSLFFTGVGLYGANWYNKKLQDEAFMRELCQEALSYGSGAIRGADTPLYRVTVILNPVASGGKARKLYEKYSAPLLNLAGMKVSVIRTESDGQAKDITEIVSDADAVLVAGGDGTVMEAVTGLLKRTDGAAARLPLGVLPVGKTNNLAHKLFDCEEDVRLMGEATMSVVRQLKKPVSLMELENKAEDEKMRGKKLYFFNRLELGAWKDARLRTDRYWLFGFGLKNYMSYIGSYTTGSKHVTWNSDINIQYSDPPTTPTTPVNVSSDSSSAGSGGLVSWLLGRNKGEAKKVEEVRNDPAEKTWRDFGHYDGPQLTIERDGESLKSILYDKTSFSDFVSHGWNLWKGRHLAQLSASPLMTSIGHQVLESGDVMLIPNTEQDESKERNICVDGETVPLMGPVQVRVVKDPIIMFCSQAEAVTEKATDGGSSMSSRWSSLVRQNKI